jgi:hypothetical protein
MTTTVEFTTPGAAGVEVDARAVRYVSEHQGVTYCEAVNPVLANDKELAKAYGQAAPRVAARRATLL